MTSVTRAYLALAAVVVLAAQFASAAVFLALKGLPILLLLVLLQRWGVADAGARRRVAGLVLSLAGGLLIEVSFIAGTAVFLLAQAAYASSVAWHLAARPRLAAGAMAVTPLTIAIVALFAIAVPQPLQTVVIAYALVETVVIAGSLATWLSAPRDPRLRDMAAGTWLFGVSDSVLAVARWWTPFDGAVIVVQSTYFAGQWLIARSALRRQVEAVADFDQRAWLQV
ncbi:MAG TPA: lysoplasmalogenase family protein [Vicinamibacterales bacterium]|nr:lysoplasmalogenase family protein [Vicinamibacterales bacterium]